MWISGKKASHGEQIWITRFHFFCLSLIRFSLVSTPYPLHFWCVPMEIGTKHTLISQPIMKHKRSKVTKDFLLSFTDPEPPETAMASGFHVHLGFSIVHEHSITTDLAPVLFAYRWIRLSEIRISDLHSNLSHDGFDFTTSQGCSGFIPSCRFLFFILSLLSRQFFLWSILLWCSKRRTESMA
jgi:hypothetical protein